MNNRIRLADVAMFAATDPRTQRVKISPTTVHTYRTSVRQLVEFLDQERDVTTITPGDLYDFGRWLDKRPLAAATSNTYKRTIRAIWGRLRKRGIEVCDTEEVFEFREENRGVKAVSISNYHKMLASSGLRDALMAALTVESGARRGGLVSMKLSRLRLWRDEKTGEMCLAAGVVEKGEKPRIVYGLNLSATLMSAWLEIRESVLKVMGVDDHDYIFISTETGQPLSIDSVQSVFNRLSQRARIPQTDPTSCHSGRHRFAIERVRAGTPLSIVAELMGHADMQTTAKIYAVLQEEELEEAFFAKATRPTYDPG